MKRMFELYVVFGVLCNLCKADGHMHYSSFAGENGIRMATTYSVTPTPGGSFTGGHFWCVGATGKVVVAKCHTVYRTLSDKTQMYGYVELLESGCFQDQAVTSVWINASIKTLPEKSFYNCSDLQEVVLPPTLER